MKATDYFMEMQHILVDERVLKGLKENKFKDSLKEFLKHLKDNNINPMDALFAPEKVIKVLSEKNTTQATFEAVSESGEDHYGVAQIAFNIQKLEKQALEQFAREIKEYPFPIALVRLQVYMWVNHLDFIGYVREKLDINTDIPLEQEEFLFWLHTFMGMSVKVAHFYAKLVNGLTPEDLEELEKVSDFLKEMTDEPNSNTIH